MLAMEYRRLGRSGVSLSVISYGNWLTHGDGVDNAAAAACVRKALEAGTTVFDTADMYADGRAEELLGSAIAGIRRESVIVCSKVGRSPHLNAQLDYAPVPRRLLYFGSQLPGC